MSDSSPRSAGFRQPAEWEPHAACWAAWPAAADLWLEDLPAAQREFAAMCRAIAGPDGREPLEVLVAQAAQEPAAREALAGLRARFHVVPYGDIWMRDIAPVFLRGPGGLGATLLRFNGWGGKYVLEGDEGVAARVADIARARPFRADLVLEGGGLEVDGEGTCLTTRSCVLNDNRNPGLSEEAAAERIRDALGVERVLWLDSGLQNDHTDGHIDTLARFVAPGVVVCMGARGDDDPNRAALRQIADGLERMRDARGRPLEVMRIPSPGRVVGRDGRVLPASYLNFYISNSTVVVPTYGAPWDDEAVEGLAVLFPGRTVVGSPAKAILSGGGAFHCITQQQPAET